MGYVRSWVAVACAILAVASFARPAAADDTLTVIGIFPSAFFDVMDAVAEYAGLYKEEHLNVVNQWSGNPSVSVQLVAAGKGDIASGNITGNILGYERGVRMTAFLSRGPHLQGVLGVLDNSPIRTLADFKGKTIGESSIGQPGEVFTSVMLAGAGLKKGDYSFAPIGIGAQAISAVATGKVDGLTQPFPQLRIYEVTGGLKFRYFFQPILNDVPDDAFFTSPQILQTKGDLIRRFARAQVKAAIFCRVNPELAAKYFAQFVGEKVTDAAIAQEVRLLAVSQDLLPANQPLSMQIGTMPLSKMSLLARFMYDNGLTSQVVPTSSIATDDFAAFANDFDHAAFIKRAKAMR
jgi:NitT/TauT family transport system substrate-binding protein